MLESRVLDVVSRLQSHQKFHQIYSLVTCFLDRSTSVSRGKKILHRCLQHLQHIPCKSTSPLPPSTSMQIAHDILNQCSLNIPLKLHLPVNVSRIHCRLATMQATRGQEILSSSSTMDPTHPIKFSKNIESVFPFNLTKLLFSDILFLNAILFQKN